MLLTTAIPRDKAPFMGNAVKFYRTECNWQTRLNVIRILSCCAITELWMNSPPGLESALHKQHHITRLHFFTRYSLFFSVCLSVSTLKEKRERTLFMKQTRLICLHGVSTQTDRFFDTLKYLSGTCLAEWGTDL